jgi:hypothetical protein
MKRQDWIDSWRAVRMGKEVWYNQYTPKADLAAYCALLIRKFSQRPATLSERLAFFKASKRINALAEKINK